MTDELDIDALFGQENGVEPMTLNPPRPSSPFGTAFLLIAAVLLGMYMNTLPGCQSLLPDGDNSRDDIVVRVDGPTVLIAWDDDGTASEGQADVLTTTKVQTWCEDNGYLYRKFDVDDDLSRTEPYWQALMESAAGPPSLTVAKENGQAVTLPLPSTVQKTIDRIQKEGK